MEHSTENLFFVHLFFLSFSDSSTECNTVSLEFLGIACLWLMIMLSKNHAVVTVALGKLLKVLIRSIVRECPKKAADARPP